MREVRIVDGEVVTAAAPPAREMDALVAEKVMGWRCVARQRGGRVVGKTAQGEFGVVGTIQTVPRYSTDIAAAWLLVERVQALHPGWRFDLIGGDASFGYQRIGRGDFAANGAELAAFGWRASFFGDADPVKNYGQRHADEWGDTPALAICRAALAAVDRTEKPDRLSAVREAETECHAEEATS